MRSCAEWHSMVGRRAWHSLSPSAALDSLPIEQRSKCRFSYCASPFQLLSCRLSPCGRGSPDKQLFSAQSDWYIDGARINAPRMWSKWLFPKCWQKAPQFLRSHLRVIWVRSNTYPWSFCTWTFWPVYSGPLSFSSFVYAKVFSPKSYCQHVWKQRVASMAW